MDRGAILWLRESKPKPSKGLHSMTFLSPKEEEIRLVIFCCDFKTLRRCEMVLEASKGITTADARDPFEIHSSSSDQPDKVVQCLHSKEKKNID